MDTWQSPDRLHTIQTITQTQQWDMLVIGGGITGVGVAREAARQGLNVLLLEQKDFAWGTSSRSSKMVHGGLRYLASGNLKLTSHSVKERERLMDEAPGLVDLMAYSWPHYKGQFPGPKVFAILLAIYDKFAGQKYRHFIDKEKTLYALPGLSEDGLMGATRFADAVTDDSRLVMRVLNEAHNDGAISLNYCQVESMVHENNHVSGVVAKDNVSGEQYTIKAKVVVSATGAWADKFRKEMGQEGKIRPLRGSHLMVASWRLPCAQAITLKHPVDGRSMFIYPWEGMTVIGTTDLDNPEMTSLEPCIQANEVEYLLTAANHLFPSSKLLRTDIVASFAGVRPIVSGGALNPSSEKRDHTIWDDQGLITVSGGKLTTFRLIALDVLKAASVYLKGLNYKDIGQNIFNAARSGSSFFGMLDSQWQRRLLGFYGQQIDGVCACAKEEGWALVPGTMTFWAQIRFAARAEAVVKLDDLMLRRTRIGLCLPEGGTQFEEKIKHICQQEMHWDDSQWQQQWQDYLSTWQRYYSLPAS
jgi:glycerol-3-phosphate dehydrogenase